MSSKKPGQGEGGPEIAEEITALGEKYGLTTAHFFETLKGFEVGRNVSREDIMRALIEDGYDELEEGKRNMIWTTLVEPDVATAIERGNLKEADNDTYEILES